MILNRLRQWFHTDPTDPPVVVRVPPGKWHIFLFHVSIPMNLVEQFDVRRVGLDPACVIKLRVRDPAHAIRIVRVNE